MFKDRMNKQKEMSKYKSMTLAQHVTNGAEGTASASLEYLNLIVQRINTASSGKDLL